MSRNNSTKSIKYLVFAALFAALTAVFTAFVHIGIPGGGYVHLGDALIYLAASMLPLPYAVSAAAIGGFFADVIAGVPIWAPASLIIKALLVLAFTYKRDKSVCPRNLIACALGIPITVIGYYIAEVLILVTGNSEAPGAALTSALAATPWNLLQAAASGIAFAVIGLTLDKSGVRKKLI